MQFSQAASSSCVNPNQPPTEKAQSLRTALLDNITQQHSLSTLIFETLSSSLSTSSRPSSNFVTTAAATTNTSYTLDDVPRLYMRLRELTEDQATLVELARRHQAAWSAAQRKRRWMEALDNQLRHMVYGMEQGKRELDEALARAHEVERGLDRAMMGKCFFSYLSGAAWPSSPAPSPVG